MAFQRHSETITCWYSRLSFPHIWEPVPVMSQGQPISEPRFSVLLILHDEIVARIQAIQTQLIAKSWPQWANGQPPVGINLRHALQRGESVRPGDPHLAGKWVLSANAKHDSKPWVVTKDPATGNFLPVTDQSLVYSGAEAHVSVGLYTTQIQVANPQINCGLNGLQITDNRLPSFDNRVSVEQALKDGPDIAAPPPPPGGPDVNAPVYYQEPQQQQQPPHGGQPVYQHPVSDQTTPKTDQDDPFNW